MAWQAVLLGASSFNDQLTHTPGDTYGHKHTRAQTHTHTHTGGLTISSEALH